MRTASPNTPHPALAGAPYEITVQCSSQFAPELAQHLSDIDLMAAVQATLRHQKVTRGSIAIAITNDETVRALNRDHRQLDAPTDILSFGSTPNAAQADLVLPPDLVEEMDSYLGDLVIAYPYTQRQAARDGRAMADELRLLVVHGTLHLLGHDHAAPEEEAAMWALQEEILRELAQEGSLKRTAAETFVEEHASGKIVLTDASKPDALARKRHADRNFFTGRWFSFRAAVDGTLHTLRSQPNAWIELAAITVVSAAGAWLQISAAEWAILALTFGLILALEAVNTAVEATIDLVSPDYHPLAKIAKDAAAGALVFAVLGSLGVAIAVFGPRLLALLG